MSCLEPPQVLFGLSQTCDKLPIHRMLTLGAGDSHVFNGQFTPHVCTKSPSIIKCPVSGFERHIMGPFGLKDKPNSALKGSIILGYKGRFVGRGRRRPYK